MASFAVSGAGARLGVVRPGGGGPARSAGGERRSGVDLPSVLFRRKDAFSRTGTPRSRFRPHSILSRSVAGSPRFSLPPSELVWRMRMCCGSKRECAVDPDWFWLSYAHRARILFSVSYMSAFQPVEAKRSSAVPEPGTCISLRQYALVLPVAIAIVSMSEPMGFLPIFVFLIAAPWKLVLIFFSVRISGPELSWLWNLQVPS